MPSQNLTPLKSDSKIVTGSLPNGITYHLVTDNSLKGLADLALVQKGQSDKEEIRKNLKSLPAFGKISPYKFLSQNGIGCSMDGYAKYSGDAAIYSFESVPSAKASVMDSTLLLIFKLAETFQGDQDIIVAGDIASKTVQERLSVLSMLVSKRAHSPKAESYVWTPVDSVTYIYNHHPNGSSATVSATFKSPRPPRESMNTSQPVVTSKFTHELGIILKNRISKELLKKGIPSSGVSFYKRSSEEGPGDELYGVSVSTDTLYTASATAVVAAALAGLDERGSSVEEYEDAKRDLYSNAMEFAKYKGVGNQSHVNRCIASYLYGSSLASSETIASMFASKGMDSSKELQLFNNFISALLDREANLTLTCSSASLKDSLDVLKTFDTSWIDYRRVAVTSSYRINSADTLGLISPSSSLKAKIKTTGEDYVSGGALWTFSNGMRVVYKKTDYNKEHFSYGLFIRGGYAGISGLQKGDQKYIEDLFSLYDVAGLQSYDFSKMLEANGVTMDAKVTPTGLSIYGKAASSSFNLLIKALLSISMEREISRKSFDYYVSSNGLLDKVVAQKDYAFQDLVEKYYADKFSNLSDAELVIVGDIPEGIAKKILSKFVGGFAQNKSTLPKTRIQDVISSGTKTEIIELDEMPEGTIPGVTVTMTAAVPFTADRLMSQYVARFYVEKALIKELSKVGVSSAVEVSYGLSPSEIFSMKVTCHPANEDGLPSGMTPPDPVDVLSIVRGVLSDVSSKTLSKADLETYKQLVLNYCDPFVKSPDTIVEAVRIRFIDGKDVLSGYTNKVKAVTSDSVQKILSDLTSGCVEELVIR